MLNITHAQASANILRFVDEERLIQSGWHDNSPNGREFACLLGAIDPSVNTPASCNGALMPLWLAQMTPLLFDGLAADQIYPVARRYGQLVAKWHALSEAQWAAILRRVLVRCIDDAVEYARAVSEGKPYWPAIERACQQCRAAIENNDKDAGAYAAARAAAYAAADAARAAAYAAARAAADAADAADAVDAAADAGARAGAYGRLFGFVMDQIEAELAEPIG